MLVGKPGKNAEGGMKFLITKREITSPEEWHWKFAFFPHRLSRTTIVWLEWYQRRMAVLDEGNWAGGFKFQWEYVSKYGQWMSEIHGD